LVAAVRRLQRWQQGTVKQMQASTFTTRVQDAGRDAADTIREAPCQQGMSSALVPPCVGLLFAEKTKTEFLAWV
jgi:hypothetical protein